MPGKPVPFSARPQKHLPRRYRWFGLLLLFALAAPSLAQRDLKNIPDPDPLSELAELEVHPDFEINLFAADPRIAKPIQINFDPSGRLWVASSEVYPQIEPGQEANDKILIIEDLDHDGVADSTTVFASGLLIPTGVEPGDGGAYVANSTELLHLKDTNGDNVADTERVMLSGFGTEDTHHILHTLRWGPEGLLYMNQSIYIHSHIETPYGVRRMNGGGVWHFRPETMQLETYTFGLVNPWGHAFDKFGQSFETDGAGGEGINYVFPDFVGITSPGAKRVFHGLNPGKPKLCGLEIIGGAHVPDDWRGDLITNDFRAHRVCRYKLTEDGAGYAARELDELVKSRHQSFRPIDVKLGPDGAIYVADWYNPIIQHGEVDFRDPRRDHTHGRIWRISAKDRPLLPYQNLATTSTKALLELLRSDEPYQRQQAKRVLKERGGGEVMPHMRLMRSEFSGRSRLEVLWVYQSLDIVNEELLNELLVDEDPRMRAGATRVLYHWQDRVSNKLRLLTKLANDKHPRVRMEASHALRHCKEPEAGLVALRGIGKPTDRFLEYALQLTADHTKDKWLPALLAGELNADTDTSALVFALKAADTAEAVPVLLKTADSWQNDPQTTREVMSLVASRGSETELASIFERAISADTTDSLRASLLAALSAAARDRKLQPKAELGEVVELLESTSQPVKHAAAELIGLWGLEQNAGRLFDLARDSQATMAGREAAIRGLAAMKQKEPLLSLDSDGTEAGIRIAAVNGLSTFDISLAAKAAASLLSRISENDDPTKLVRAFLLQNGGDEALVTALADQQSDISADVAKLCIRTARSSGRDVGTLVRQLQQAGGISGQTTTLSPEEQQQLLVDSVDHGDAALGETVYRREALNCQKCHAIGGAGGKVGPDMASIGASAPPDYILQSLLDPGAKIKENYHSQIVATDEGQVITGILLRETNDALIVRDAEDNEISIPLDSIEERKDGGSLMPAGLLNELTRQEMLDLVRFLTELGKIGDYALPREPYIRTWETLAATPSNRNLLQRRSEAEVAVLPQFQWRITCSKVNGELPDGELTKFRPKSTKTDVCYLRFPLVSTNDDTKTLRLQRTDGVRVYVDGQPVPTKEFVSLELSQGSHSVMLAVDDLAGGQPIRVSVE